MSSLYSGNINISIFGESHGAAVGVVLDGFPVGVIVREGHIADMLLRRGAKNHSYSTKRHEPDEYKILSGVTDGRTNGSPVCIIIENKNIKPSDYNLEAVRPSHADYTAHVRYGGYNAKTGGGHFSGRVTAALVLAGALCNMYLEQFGVKISAHISRAGKVQDDNFHPVNPIHADYDPVTGLSLLNKGCGDKMLAAIKLLASGGDSAGGVIECLATGVRAGIGSPNMGGLENKISALAFSVPAVKGIEFGAGFAIADMLGSQANDQAEKLDKTGIRTLTNHSGGINGGISNGMPIIFRVAVRPTPSISLPQESVDFKGEKKQLIIKGRHDPCIVPRAVPIIESVMAVVLADMYKGAEGYADTW